MALRKFLAFDSATGFPEEAPATDTLALGGLAMSGDITMAGNEVTGLPATPSGATAAASKQYVDSIAAGLDLKENVRLATDAALPANTAAGSGVGKTLTADAVGILTVDGSAVLLNDEILVKDETAGADIDHGIYECTTEGTAGVAFVLTRRADFDGTPSGEVSKGSFCFVREGTANGNTGWAVLTADPITVDTTAIEFSQFQGLPSFIGDLGIDISGDNISVDIAAVSGLDFDAGSPNGKLRVDVANTDELSLDGSGLNVEGVPTLFNIGATPVGATVTAPNLDTLTDGSNADALHVHAGAGNAQQVKNTYNADTGGVTLGDPVFHSGNDVVSPCDAANNDSRKFVGVAEDTAAVGNPSDIISDGPVAGVIAGATAGDIYYLAAGGGLTVTPPGSGNHRLVVGKAINATDLFVSAQYLGKVA